MNYKDFLDASSYLKTILQCHQTDKLFNHLISKDEDIIETITRLYQNDDFEKLFDPVYKQITDSEFSEKIGLVTDEIIVSEYSGVEIDRAFLIILRTENYQYNIINGSISKEANYALSWFKSEINSNEIDNHKSELTRFLLGNEKYIGIDDEECDDYSSSDVICVWQNDNFYHLVTEAAYDEKQNEEEEDDYVEEDEVEDDDD